MKRNILITGGAGFIGSHVVRLFVNKYPEYHIINLDKLTYAGNLANLKDIEGQPNYTFVKADICDFERIIQLFKQYNIDSVIHLAAESHVDRSIKDPFIFAQTNVMGTLSLLQAAKLAWETSETGYDHKLFYHISTDEVYGALDFDGTFFTEQTKYQPHSPYSASKAGSDHFVRAFHDTYGMPVIVTNCSNNYGPYQFPEKLIPLFINNIRHGKALPVYGKGENVRDWLYVVDHARAIDIIFHKGKIAETYNIGGFNEWTNIDLIKVIIKTVDRLLGNPDGHVVRLFVNKYPEYHIINLDKLTYAGNLANLKDIEGQPNYTFVKADICDFERIIQLFKQYNIDSVIHLAAESHVDRSIKDPFIFAQTNVMGTLSLLQAAKLAWETSETGYDHKLFYHISTDEVYGALDFDGTFFTEQTKYQPHSPYSASKAGSDHFVRAFHDTYGMPVIVTNCSNNYGPYQFPEKLIPLFINNIRHGKALPVYGKGENVRDWLYVVDHARAIDIIFHKGKIAETYNIGGFNEWTNIDLIKVIIKTVDRLLGNPDGTSEKLITYVADRKGHDLRYAIDSNKLKKELGWEPSLQFEEGIEKTVRWYLENNEWMENIASGEYNKYYESMYKI